MAAQGQGGGEAGPGRTDRSGGGPGFLGLAAGAARGGVGPAVCAEPGALGRFAGALGERLVVAIDARAGRVALAGWERDSGLAVEEAAARGAAAGGRRPPRPAPSARA